MTTEVTGKRFKTCLNCVLRLNLLVKFCPVCGGHKFKPS